MPLTRPCFVAAVAGTLMAASSARAAEPEAYSLDPVHTRVMVAVEHAGFSRALGIASGSTGSVWFDPEDLAATRWDISLPLTRLDFGDAKWNSAVQAANLLDASRHPEARFVSTGVTPVDARHARACGDLTVRGTTTPLCLDVTVNAVKRHPLPPFRRTAGFSATGTLSRSALGMAAWPSLIGDSIELRIEAEAVRARNDEPASAPDAAAPPKATGGTPSPIGPPEPRP
ncbi:YceI family protein [Aerolutibacter ruishenii]|uniref:Polyisoprenoid-binding protein YceI n=1 Tax=Aerolutibacter ruishenii TaxID=686800 RepID=A0A562LP75_9GAMM|nr:YceI family protein [Lysobacter ruishenii]TWI09439.1 polyisoprenoid-binding protein YceI [Lysobacter ruishenii]